ncbi:xylulokinase [Anaerobium acetethylicum]|uniref:Xylulose kinase n=1 Tax=Anaerobium acetethylicum TaxID=1619234 RepID=A0A1D3TWK3_9FIRM|nr:xylulokinase [Anaerobium acetethylicum]SCP98620.1 xylulokinase [Anaerobium acetethylicum]
MPYLIGIDLGTSATKTIMIDENGAIVASALQQYPMYQPQNGWAEQDPSDWKDAVLKTIKEVVEQAGVEKEEILGIGLSGQMHGLVMLDEKNEPIGKSIIWCDQRTEKQVKEMHEILPLSKWLQITANPPLAAWTAAKILWTRDNEPEKYQVCRHILLPKDYIRQVLTGEFATDVSDASGMQLLDVKNRCWSDEILNALHIDKNLLGTVHESQEITGTVKKEIADICGLSDKTIVVAGASDNASAAIGTGVVNDGEAFTTIGTSAIVYTHLDSYKEIPEGSLHICCCAVPGCWHTMGGPQSAGLSLEWFKNNFCTDYDVEAEEREMDVYSLMNEKIDRVPIGSDKLIFLPFLMGERTPHMDPKYRGAFLGLNAVHKKENLLRAVMEGVSYSLADCNNILKSIGTVVNSMRVCGGGSKSPVWQKIMAALYDCDIKTLKQEEGPAYGACILAGVAAGVFENIQKACEEFVKEDKTIYCNRNDMEKYKKYHKLYDRFYEALKDEFGLLADIDE